MVAWLPPGRAPCLCRSTRNWVSVPVLGAPSPAPASGPSQSTWFTTQLWTLSWHSCPGKAGPRGAGNPCFCSLTLRDRNEETRQPLVPCSPLGQAVKGQWAQWRGPAPQVWFPAGWAQVAPLGAKAGTLACAGSPSSAPGHLTHGMPQTSPVADLFPACSSVLVTVHL